MKGSIIMPQFKIFRGQTMSRQSIHAALLSISLMLSTPFVFAAKLIDHSTPPADMSNLVGRFLQLESVSIKTSKDISDNQKRLNAFVADTDLKKAAADKLIAESEKLFDSIRSNPDFEKTLTLDFVNNLSTRLSSLREYSAAIETKRAQLTSQATASFTAHCNDRNLRRSIIGNGEFEFGGEKRLGFGNIQNCPRLNFNMLTIKEIPGATQEVGLELSRTAGPLNAYTKIESLTTKAVCEITVEAGLVDLWQDTTVTCSLRHNQGLITFSVLRPPIEWPSFFR
jgi:hypothetical protein